MQKKTEENENQSIAQTEVMKLSPLAKVKRIKNCRDAQNLLSKLISSFCKGLINDNESRTLTYLLVSYVNIAKTTDLETRLEMLEGSVSP